MAGDICFLKSSPCHAQKAEHPSAGVGPGRSASRRRVAALTAGIKEKTAQAQENQSVNPFPSVSIPSERPKQPPTFLELLNRAYAKSSASQSRYGKIQDLKLYAKAFNFLQDKNITPLLQLQEVVSEMKKRSRNTNGEIKQTELTLYQTAERYLKEHLGKDNVLKLNAWKTEVSDLSEKKRRLYEDLQTLRAEVQEAEAVKKCVEQAIQPEQSKEKAQSKRRDMEL